MISHSNTKPGLPAFYRDKYLGTIGYLAIFISSIIIVMVVPIQWIPLAAAGCLLVAWLVYPHSFRSLIRLRWLVMIGLLSLPPIFITGEVDRQLFGIPYSSEGLMIGIQVALRILVVLISVQGFTSSVDISSIAGLLERIGLHGLGFSFGVALNLLPSFQQSALNAWRALWMRGGLRKNRWRAIRLLGMTIVANALNRAEEIALAAEVRAFSPDRTRSMPLKVGKWDWAVLAISSMAVLGCVLIAW
jgi:energy-coupling factor transporter transmembrane protein EcfT